MIVKYIETQTIPANNDGGEINDEETIEVEITSKAKIYITFEVDDETKREIEADSYSEAISLIRNIERDYPEQDEIVF